MLLSTSEIDAAFDRLRVRGRFSQSELTRLEAACPQDRPDYCTFPIPEDGEALTVLGLRQQLGVSPRGECGFFDHPWYLDEPFGRTACRPGWHAVAVGPQPETLNQPVSYAEALRAGGLILPQAIEVVLMLFLSLTARDERFLLRKHTWTCDRTVSGRWVSVGAFGEKGVFVSSHDAGYRSRGLGMCPARSDLGARTA